MTSQFQLNVEMQAERQHSIQKVLRMAQRCERKAQARGLKGAKWQQAANFWYAVAQRMGEIGK